MFIKATKMFRKFNIVKSETLDCVLITKFN